MTRVSPLILALVMSVFSAQAAITLLWDANTETNLASYRLHQGPASRNYTTNFNAGTNTTFIVTNLFNGTNYFAVTAFDTDGLENEYSDEIFWANTNRLSKVKNLRFASRMNVQSAPAPTGPWSPEFELGQVELTGQARFFRLAIIAPEPALLIAPQKQLRFDGSKSGKLPLMTPKRPRQGLPFPG